MVAVASASLGWGTYVGNGDVLGAKVILVVQT